jgi:uncharacterized protein YbjT (DUF2867 family)
MKVAIFGGTGFVGGYIIDELVAQGHQPRVLVRGGSEHKLRQAEACVPVSGDIGDEDALRETLSGVETAIYLIGILRERPDLGVTFEALQYEGARRVIDLAQELGVGRVLLMSANGVKPDGTAYQRTKFRAEDYLRDSRLEWTIFRPSVVFGDPRGRMEFATQLYRDVIRSPLPAPLFHEGLLPFGAGSFRLSPVHASDVAAAFVRSLELPAAAGQVYRLCGPDALEWRTILEIIAAAGGRRKLYLPAPAWAVNTVAGMLERFAFFPVTRDQISMLLEGNACAPADLREGLGIEPTPFNQETLRYLAGNAN